MKTKILAGLLLAGGAAFAAPRVSFGIGIGVPAPIAVAAPPCPGPGYVFVDGYWRPGPVVWRAPVRFEGRRVEHFDHFRR
jgi:hypothetical protein